MKKYELLKLRELLNKEISRRKRIKELLECDLVKEYLSITNTPWVNLDINDIFRIYEERIGSRIIGYYDIYRFFGEDLRFKR